MATTFQLKRSSVEGKLPNVADLQVGELAVNLADGILYSKNTAGNIIVVGSSTTSNVTEGVNLYFTNTRAVSAFTSGSGISVAANGLITANITPGLTESSIATLTNKTFDVSVGSNNIFSIQGQSLTSYTGSGQIVVLSQSPTISVLNISDSQMNFDGGSGSLYWTGQSGVAQTGDLKAGVYASDPASNNSLFTFATNGSNYMSVGIEGSLFVGTALPSNNGGLNTTFPGWLVVQSGGKFGGTINTLGALQFDDALTGKIIFADGTTQNTAFTTNILTTANVVETTSLYFTNTRAISAFTAGTGILIESNGFIAATTTTGETGGFVSSTLVNYPTGDYGSGESFVSPSGLSDAFGVSLVNVYDCMEPIGRLLTEDFEALT